MLFKCEYDIQNAETEQRKVQGAMGKMGMQSAERSVLVNSPLTALSLSLHSYLSILVHIKGAVHGIKSVCQARHQLGWEENSLVTEGCRARSSTMCKLTNV